MEKFPGVGKCVGHTTNIEEAQKIKEQYELQGFEVKIFEKKEAGLILYELWIFKKKQGLA